MAGRIDPTRPWNWWSDANQGGGVLAAIGSHAFDGIRWLMNDPDITISGATVGTIYPQRKDAGGTLLPVTSDDIVSVSFAVDGAVGTMLLHTVALDGNVDLLTFRGTDGTLVNRPVAKAVSPASATASSRNTRPSCPASYPTASGPPRYAAGTVLLGRAIVTALAKNDAGRSLRPPPSPMGPRYSDSSIGYAPWPTWRLRGSALDCADADANLQPI